MMESVEKGLENNIIYHKGRRLVLGVSLHGWEQLRLASLALAAIAAALVVFTTTSVVILQRMENAETKGEYEAYKLTASRDIAAAEARGKIAEQKAAEANQKAAEARERAARIEEAAAWRILDSAHSRSFKNEITDGAGRAITLGFTVGDPEVISLAIQLTELFATAKWNVKNVGHWYTAELVPGIRVLGSDEDGIKIVKRALSAANLAYTGEPVPVPAMYRGGTPDETTLFLYIGTKSAPKFSVRE